MPAGSGAMRSCAVPASRVSGMSAGPISPPLAPPAADHSAAIASARRGASTCSGLPPGSRTGLPSSNTR